MYRYFKMITNTKYISSWKSKGLFDESFKPPTTSNNSLNPTLNYYYGTKIRVKFTKSCLKQSKISHNHGKVVHIYIVYEIEGNTYSYNYPTLENCLFGAVTLTKNNDMELDLIEKEILHFRVVDMVKMQ